MRLFGFCFSFTFLCFFILSYFGTSTTAADEGVLLSTLKSGRDGVNGDLASVSKGRLVFAHVIYRHGDRMPIECYPTDPYKKREFWPTGWGQLTNIGKLEQYHLGQWLRKRYDSLLSHTYSNDEIYIRSTDVDRTLMSALSNLAGLYPPIDQQIWNKDIKWQPIPVHTIPDGFDEIMGKQPCAAYEHALSEVLNSEEFQTLNNRFTYLYNYLTKFTGRKIGTMEDVQRINNTFFIEELYNKTLPDWTKKVYPSTDMTYISDFYFSVPTYTRKLARFKAGPLIKEMFQRFNDKLQHKLNPDRNVWIYSAHDTTVANVLNTLKIFDLHSPDYTACILLEMRMNEKQQPLISIYYKNNTAIMDPPPIYIPGCGFSCPLRNMYNLYKDIIPDDWEEECKLSTLLMTYDDANISMALGILVAILSAMVFLSYMVLIYYRRRSYRAQYSYSQVA